VLLLAADAALRGCLTDALRRAGLDLPVVEVDNDLMALGAIGAGLEPAVVIVRADAVAAAELDQAARGLQALAPEARLLAVMRSPQHAGAPGVFEQVLVEPVHADELAAALRAKPIAPAPGSAEPVHAGEPAAAGNIKPVAAAAAAPAPVDPLSDAGCVDALIQRVLGLTTASAPPNPAPAAAADLGDVDLVEQLLTDRHDLTALGLRMIAQHGGLAGAALVAEPAQVPAGHAWSAVEFHGLGLGLLHAPPPATHEALGPWAAWLARWLALGRQMDRLWDLALRDDLTGAWNRRYFLRFLRAILDRAGRERFRVTLMVFDIDDFKSYNDRFGHAAGDEILRETARLMGSVVRTHDVVARIGGDEFAVIFWDAQGPRKPHSEHPVDVRKAAERFQQAIRTKKFPKLLCDVPVSLTISGGLAGFPWDGRSPEELLGRADAMALCCKQQGKNALVFGPGAMLGDPAAAHVEGT
jgi:diguanylate cyclase (GGDEF)-like protein